MILEHLANLCHRIRVIEHEYDLPPHIKNGDMRVQSIVWKQQREEGLMRDLYQIVKKYALESK